MRQLYSNAPTTRWVQLTIDHCSDNTVAKPKSSKVDREKERNKKKQRKRLEKARKKKFIEGKNVATIKETRNTFFSIVVAVTPPLPPPVVVAAAAAAAAESATKSDEWLDSCLQDNSRQSFGNRKTKWIMTRPPQTQICDQWKWRVIPFFVCFFLTVGVLLGVYRARAGNERLDAKGLHDSTSQSG